MARSIWKGSITFGLVNIPVGLYSAEKREETVSFHMLDRRNMARLRYKRVNEETGREVPWEETVRGYEVEGGKHVVISDEDLERASPEKTQTVDILDFVEAGDISPLFFDKPYYLVPEKKGAKSYALLRETLRRVNKVGIAKVVIRTREYLCAVRPHGDALVLLLMRFPQELVDVADYALPEGKAADYRISKRELDMAEELISAMSAKFDPSDYKDEFTARLRAVIARRVKEKGATTRIADRGEEPAEDAATNVVDFMSLLQKSLQSNKRTPAAKKAAKAPARKVTRTARATKAAPARKKAAAKTARR